MTAPLSRQETTALILRLAYEHDLPFPQGIEFVEKGGTDGDISSLSLNFDGADGYNAWADFLEIPEGWKRREQPSLDGLRTIHTAVRFDWNGWRQVQLHALERITVAVAS